MRVAFFQRIFAHYQSGLVKELAFHSIHDYHFFGDDRDPARSGIDPIPEELRILLPFTVCRTKHLNKYFAFQWRAVLVALFGRFDVLIFEGSFLLPTNWLAMMAAKARHKRVLLYTHGWLRWETGLKAFLRNAFYKLADGLLLYGNRARQIGLRNGFSSDLQYVVFNSLDEESMRPWRECVTPALCDAFRTEWFGVDAANPLIVSVGRLTAAKQYLLLLQATSCLKKLGLEINILLVGDGPELLLLKQKAAELGVNLALPGKRNDEAFLSLCLTSADMTVIPGSAGLTVIHSLSYGTPVIVNSEEDRQGPETEAVQNGINGAKFKAGDVFSLSKAIIQVLRDLPLGSRVVARQRSFIENAYSPARMRKVFDDAVSGCSAIIPVK